MRATNDVVVDFFFVNSLISINKIAERWPSGRRRSPAKGVYPNPVSRVRIPPSPPLFTYTVNNGGETEKRLIFKRFFSFEKKQKTFKKLFKKFVDF